ncbi:phospholipase D-like domain-containing protein [uncultured Salegentibacter sp.]|uniref:phospholipase D-like domain-containing protein n=1 Tax=uncultured Salegentibacter sp. TaxID=259320 RepID=UPI002593BA1B|nr:phospholipase D-like domain-containing protein [uncultured Salegentibacter sp.]
MQITTYFTKHTDVKKIIIQLLDSASTQVNVAVAWFTEPKLFNKLLEIQERGVNVELVITSHEFNRNSRNDYSLIEENGGFFTEIGNDEQLMHMKFCVIDYKTVISGSANWSKSAFTKHNEEVTIVEENLPRANDFMAEFERLKDISGKIQKLQRDFNISQAIKTFEVIKALINIGDTQYIQPYIYRIKNIPELEAITDYLLAGDYDEAIKEIDLFKQNYTQIVSVSEIEKSQILTQIKLLSYQIEIMEFEKVEKEALIDHFNHRYILELNPLISKILELKKKIYNKLKKHGIVDDTYEKIDEEFRKRNQEYEDEKEIEIPDLSQDETKTLKQSYKDASKLCHPDSLECIFEDKDEAAQVFAELSNAYKINDLVKVQYILSKLKLGKPVTNLNEFDELAHLRTRLETLKVKYDKLQLDIQEIITSETFEIIEAIEDWDIYFKEQKKLLETEFENLTAKYTNNEQQTSKI